MTTTAHIALISRQELEALVLRIDKAYSKQKKEVKFKKIRPVRSIK